MVSMEWGSLLHLFTLTMDIMIIEDKADLN